MSGRVAAGIAWLLCGLSLAMIAGAVVLASLNRHGIASVAFLFPEISAALVGGIITSRRPANPVGWFVIGHAVCFCLGEFARQYAIYGVLTEPGSLPAARAMASIPYWIWLPGIFFVFGLLPLYFPDGKLISPRWRPVVWLTVLAAGTESLSAAVQEGDLETPGIPNPLGIAGLTLDDWIYGLAGPGLWLAIGMVAAVSLVLRFKRSRGVERQQLKWVVGGVVVVIFAALVSQLVLPELPPWSLDVSLLLFFIPFQALWVTIAIAMLRYRLYEIDVLINRTLVYGTLTVSLAAVYFGGVALGQWALRTLTGGESGLAVVASTLAIAGLFQPLRRRIQTVIDQRLYRRKYDAAQTLQVYSASLRDEVDLEALTDRLVGVVQETVQPEHVSLWLRAPSAPRSMLR